MGWTKMKSLCYRKAFTLAEVLITLGIIGVVAAMTMPSLVNRVRQQELETGFKKQYSLLQQAIMRVRAEDDIPFTTEFYGRDNNRFMSALAKQYKVIKDCGVIHQNKGCVLLNDEGAVSQYKTLRGTTIDHQYFDDGGFIATDGTAFFVEQGSQSDTTGFIVSIDVNGFKKGPNKMGYDFFMFQIAPVGKVIPMGAPDSAFESYRDAYCSHTALHNKNGYTCAYFAVNDSSYFKNLH